MGLEAGLLYRSPPGGRLIVVASTGSTKAIRDLVDGFLRDLNAQATLLSDQDPRAADLRRLEADRLARAVALCGEQDSS